VDEPEPAPPQVDPQAAAREAIRQTRPAGGPPEPGGPSLAQADADASPDDLDADHEDLGTDDLLARHLGAQMIEEIPHQ
ncbi:MAG: polymerase subunit gamma and tau, partial [Nocardioides sp.]|nr:polymerase subunit gamma and tau [Nocardioides sp.]